MIGVVFEKYNEAVNLVFQSVFTLLHQSNRSDAPHVLQLRHLRLEWVFLPVCVLRCLLVSLISAPDVNFLTGEHSLGGLADSASPHLVS